MWKIRILTAKWDAELTSEHRSPAQNGKTFLLIKNPNKTFKKTATITKTPDSLCCLQVVLLNLHHA